MRKNILSVLVIMSLLMMCVVALPTEVLADVQADYLDEAGILHTVTAKPILGGEEITLDSVWYVVDGNVTPTGTITVTGNVKLILADGGELTVTADRTDAAGINVTGINSLTIYGQSGGTGVLKAKGGQDGAGIGGGKNQSGGIIAIIGGTVKSEACGTGAGIGGGLSGDGGTITIRGGTVEATGGSGYHIENVMTGGGAGIGGGGRNGDTPGGDGGTITISGDSTAIVATGGVGAAGIGGGWHGGGGNIIINGGTVNATGSSGWGAPLNAGPMGGAGIGGGSDRDGGNIEISGTGTVVAIGGNWAAGIGGGSQSGGAILAISGGTISATGGDRGAGIGGGGGGPSGGGNGGTVTISGGTVEARGGNFGTGIGGGMDGDGGTIVLSGGVVFADGSLDAMDVGAGCNSSSEGSLEISGTAALFLKNDRYVELVDTATHSHIGAFADVLPGHIGGDAVYGIPVGWDLDFGAWLRLPLSTITFDSNDGSAVDPITQHVGTTITAPSDPPIREGYTFDGWDPGVPETMPEEDVTITAQWTINEYTITFDSAGGTDVTSITQDYGTPIVIPADPYRLGYYFDGWEPDVPGTMPAADLSVVAQWAPWILGDFNGDRRVDDMDVVYLLRHTLSDVDYPIVGYADFTHDEVVDDKDVVYLLRHTLAPDDYPLTRLE